MKIENMFPSKYLRAADLPRSGMAAMTSTSCTFSKKSAGSL
jgi:hypothetical protein